MSGGGRGGEGRGCCEVYVLPCSGSTYDDILVDQTQSLSAAVHGRSTAQPNTYTDLHEWLGQGTTSTTTAQQTAESATSAGRQLFLLLMLHHFHLFFLHLRV